MNAGMHVCDVGFEVLRIILPGDPVHPRRRIPLEPGIGILEEVDAHMLEQRGEPFLLPCLCCLPYAV
jgi:hypothetical protein